MSKIFEIEFKKPLVKFVFIALADCANSEGECYPSIPTIAKKCSMSESSVYRAIKELQKMNMIEKENRVHKDGRNRSNIYQIILGTLSTGHPHPVSLTPSPLSTGHPSKENHKKEPSKESISEKNKTQSWPMVPPAQQDPELNPNTCCKEDVTNWQKDTFDLFWKSYPRRVKKEQAFKAFKKHGCAAVISNIQEDIEFRMKNDTTWKDIQFIPYPASYLNSMRWEEERLNKKQPTKATFYSTWE